MYEEFLDRYCKERGVSKEEALEHALVKEFMKEKERVSRETVVKKNERL